MNPGAGAPRDRDPEGERRDELQRSLHFKQMCLDVLGHDLKNPLSIARIRLELIRNRHPEVRDELDVVERNLDRATRLIEASLMYSRMEARQGLELRQTNLTPLAAEVVEHQRPYAEARGIVLRLSTHGPTQAPANPLLAQALENLLSNAIKWSPDGREVTVVLEGRDEGCLIAIVDHGPGIPDEEKPRLFQRFERGEAGAVEGTGLGLAIAKRIVDMHHGAIRVEDTPGGGCTVVLDLRAPHAQAVSGAARAR